MVSVGARFDVLPRIEILLHLKESLPNAFRRFGSLREWPSSQILSIDDYSHITVYTSSVCYLSFLSINNDNMDMVYLIQFKIKKTSVKSRLHLLFSRILCREPCGRVDIHILIEYSPHIGFLRMKTKIVNN